MKPQEFIDQVKGKWLIRRYANGVYTKILQDTKSPEAQCMTLTSQFVCDVFGYPSEKASPLAAPTAYEAFLKGHPDFIKIETTDVNQIRKYDLVFWSPKINWNPATQTGAGHVALALYVTKDGNFVSLDQNFPEGQRVQENEHSMHYVVGILRHKSLVEITKKRMKLFEKAGQIIYVLHEGEPTEFWLIFKDKDGVEKKREILKFAATVPVYAENEKYFEWKTDQQLKQLKDMPEGKPFDLAEYIKANPECMEKE